MPSRARSTRSGALLAAAGLTVVLAACGTSAGNEVVGSGGAPTTTTPTTTATTAPTTTEPTTPSITSPVATVACPLIPGLPNTENGIFDLSASGTDCAAATALGTRALHSEQGKPFAAAGFDCTSRYDTRGYPSYRYTCTSGEKQVTFVYSR